MRAFGILVLGLALSAYGCKKDSDSKSKAGGGGSGGNDDGGNTDTGTTPDGGPGGDEGGGVDTIILDNEATIVALDVLPVSERAEYATVEETRTEGTSFAAGTLAIDSGGASLHGSAFALTGVADAIPVGKIGSGSPEAMKVLVHKVMLQTADSKATVLFEHAAGREILIEDGKADLSKLFDGATDETTPAFAATPGEYVQVVVTYGNIAEVKGCVTADFATVGDKTYCTTANKSLYDDCTTGCEEGDFKADTPDWAKMSLSKTGPDDETVQVTYDTGEKIVIKDKETIKLTLILDMNRMLRFYNNSTDTVSAGALFPTTYAYFFTTVFEDSTFVFAGEAGRIYGYQMSYHGCRGPSATAYVSAAQTCSAGGDTTHNVGGWMTIITDKTGKPLIVNLMPDDDNALLIAKGTIIGVETPFEEGTAPSKANINYGIPGDKTGKLKDFPALLEADGRGEAVDGVTFEATHSSGEIKGYVNITRAL